MTTTSTTARKSTTTKTSTTTTSTTKKTTTTTKRTTEKNTPATTEQKSTTQKSSGSQIASVKKSSAANHQSTFMNMVTIFFVFMALNKLWMYNCWTSNVKLHSCVNSHFRKDYSAFLLKITIANLEEFGLLTQVHWDSLLRIFKLKFILLLSELIKNV